MLKNKSSARQLGYYLFWNLRASDSGLALSETDVKETAERAGLRHEDSAWRLLDRNADSFATLSEVLQSVEQVYDNRKALARTLDDSQTVVKQVERAIYVTLFVVLIFVIVALFDFESLQRTWTGLSAGLLSFSFVFGNSIRQVCCTSLCPFQRFLGTLGVPLQREGGEYASLVLESLSQLGIKVG
jgi:hypothetical protein